MKEANEADISTPGEGDEGKKKKKKGGKEETKEKGNKKFYCSFLSSKLIQVTFARI